MIFLRFLILSALVLCFQATAPSALAADAVWLAFDGLGADRPLAESALADMFGEDPDLWPDWLDPRGVLLKAGGNDSVLIVREPYRQACGQYLFILFGPRGADGTRQRLESGFCAGEMTVLQIKGRGMPDFLFSEGRRKNPADGTWSRVDQRVRWTGTGWVRILGK